MVTVVSSLERHDDGTTARHLGAKTLRAKIQSLLKKKTVVEMNSLLHKKLPSFETEKNQTTESLTGKIKT